MTRGHASRQHNLTIMIMAFGSLTTANPGLASAPQVSPGGLFESGLSRAISSNWAGAPALRRDMRQGGTRGESRARNPDEANTKTVTSLANRLWKKIGIIRGYELLRIYRACPFFVGLPRLTSLSDSPYIRAVFDRYESVGDSRMA